MHIRLAWAFAGKSTRVGPLVISLADAVQRV